MTQTFKATVELYLNVNDEAEACDAVSESLRPLLNRFDPASCIIDWRYNQTHSTPVPVTEAEIDALEE